MPYFEIVVELLGREEACRVCIALRHAPVLLRQMALLVLLLLELLFHCCLVQQRLRLRLARRVLLLSLRTVIYALVRHAGQR